MGKRTPFAQSIFSPRLRLTGPVEQTHNCAMKTSLARACSVSMVVLALGAASMPAAANLPDLSQAIEDLKNSDAVWRREQAEFRTLRKAGKLTAEEAAEYAEFVASLHRQKLLECERVRVLGGDTALKEYECLVPAARQSPEPGKRGDAAADQPQPETPEEANTSERSTSDRATDKPGSSKTPGGPKSTREAGSQETAEQPPAQADEKPSRDGGGTGQAQDSEQTDAPETGSAKRSTDGSPDASQRADNPDPVATRPGENGARAPQPDTLPMPLPVPAALPSAVPGTSPSAAPGSSTASSRGSSSGSSSGTSPGSSAGSPSGAAGASSTAADGGRDGSPAGTRQSAALPQSDADDGVKTDSERVDDLERELGRLEAELDEALLRGQTEARQRAARSGGGKSGSANDGSGESGNGASGREAAQGKGKGDQQSQNPQTAQGEAREGGSDKIPGENGSGEQGDIARGGERQEGTVERGAGPGVPKDHEKQSAAAGKGESGDDDDVVLRQIREAAERETDPVLKEKLWEEYRRLKKARN